MAEPASRARTAWLTATLALTIGPIVALPWLAPNASHQPAVGLGWLLFVGSSVHVASTGWFYTVRDVRAHMRDHPGRFVLAPAAFVAAGVTAAVTQPPRALAIAVVALFGWQFVHFAKQNLGVAALAARSHGVPAPSRDERRVLMAAAAGVVLALVAHPRLLQVEGAPDRFGVLFPIGATVFATAVLVGVVLLLRRPAEQRPATYVLAYGTSLLFFTPVWLFASPYAAIAGLTIAHGLQYLLLMGLVAGGGRPRRAATVSVVVLVDVAVLAGLALNRMSHLHDAGPAGRALYGVFLGLTAAHFVADAGLWRLRDAFPREFLGTRLPYLLAPAIAGDGRPAFPVAGPQSGAISVPSTGKVSPNPAYLRAVHTVRCTRGGRCVRIRACCSRTGRSASYSSRSGCSASST